MVELPSAEPLCEQEEQEDFRGLGCHRDGRLFIETSIRSWGTVVDGGWKGDSAITLVKPKCMTETSPQKQAAPPKLAQGQGGSECDSPKAPNHNQTLSLSPPDPVKATTKIQRLWLQNREEDSRRGKERGSAEPEDRPIPAQRTSPRHAPIQFCSQEGDIRVGDLLDTSWERLEA